MLLEGLMIRRFFRWVTGAGPDFCGEIIPTSPLRRNWREPIVQKLHVDAGEWIRITGDGPTYFVTFTREAMLRIVTVA